MKILFAESDFWEKNKIFRQKYEDAVKSAYNDVKKLLPDTPSQLTFVVQTSSWETIPETGEMGYTRNSRLILLSIDPKMPFDEDKLLKNVKASVFHELNHAARYENGIWHKSFLDSCIMEGLATVFERDYARAKPLWGQYKTTEAKQWLKEIKAFKDNYNWADYMYKHPDGRRWIGYKVGTYIIDEAIKKSKKSIAELTKIECTEILNLSKLI